MALLNRNATAGAAAWPGDLVAPAATARTIGGRHTRAHRPPPISGRAFFVLVGLLVLGPVFVPGADAPARPALPMVPVDREELYVAFTLNLTRFITWPENAFATPDAPLVIGTFPRDPINSALDEAARTEKFEGRAVRTIRIQSLDDVEKCNVVFLSRNDSARPASVLARV